MRILGITLTVLAVVFFIVAVSIGCARRPRPMAAPAAASAPATQAPAPEAPEAKEGVPPTETEKELPTRVIERPALPPTEPAPSPMPEEQSARSEEGEVAAVEELKDIPFDYDRYDIRPDVRPILERNAQWIKAQARARVQIEGHADERGTVEYNLALGDRRAKSIQDYLISLGVNPKQLSTVSFGEERPLDPGHTEEAWAKNRRAHFVLLK